MQYERLAEIMRQNETVTASYSRYLNLQPRVITADTVRKIASTCRVDTEEAYLSLFSAVLGWDTEQNEQHAHLEDTYLCQGLHRLNPDVYQNDPYCRAVRFPSVKSGAWELKESSYAPYEPFICDHLLCTDDLREIPQIGYFEEEFRFPAVLENGIEWMTVTPLEIETMCEPISHARGRVLTLGLGLGYYAFSAAQRECVSSVTVVERDPRIIALFNEHLLPQFPHREKITVIEADAIAYLQELPQTAFDSIFVDLWRDQSDGLELYLAICRIEKQRGLRNVDYWIESTLLSSLRHMVWNRINDPRTPMNLHGADPRELLTDAFLKKLAPSIPQSPNP
ncbi:MAG: hypothetical protein E7637_07995 [Ruminococcaceae bacterium]|nr:hypothetical protein [Oscillospiraceae bacterium]